MFDKIFEFLGIAVMGIMIIVFIPLFLLLYVIAWALTDDNKFMEFMKTRGKS